MRPEKVQERTIHRFNIFGYLDAEAAAEAISIMWEADCQDPHSAWDVVINSEGGDMEAGTAIFSELRAHSTRGGGTHWVTTRVRGQAASCGSLVLQAGDRRIAGKLDYIMLHEPLMSFADASLQRVRDELDQAQSWLDLYLDVMMERAKEPRSMFETNIANRDWWVNAATALQIGLIDEVA